MGIDIEPGQVWDTMQIRLTKPPEHALLTRTVISLEAGRVSYQEPGELVKTCSLSSFRQWQKRTRARLVAAK